MYQPKPLFYPSKTKLPSQRELGEKSGGNLIAMIKDSLEISTWMSIGALGLTGLIFLVGRVAFLIPAAIVTVKLADTLATVYGLKENKRMREIVMAKFSAQIPDEKGDFSPQPASENVTVLLIGTRCSHPLGLLAPGFKQTGDYMTDMQKELEADPGKHGLLGTSTWIGSQDSSMNTTMYVMYFRNVEKLHEYAQGPLHREAWSWWSAKYKDMPYISIWHEVFESPKGHWETIYQNSPRTLLAGGQSRAMVKTEQGEEERWTSTIVDASSGVMRSHRGRMQRDEDPNASHMYINVEGGVVQEV